MLMHAMKLKISVEMPGVNEGGVMVSEAEEGRLIFFTSLQGPALQLPLLPLLPLPLPPLDQILVIWFHQITDCLTNVDFFPERHG